MRIVRNKWFIVAAVIALIAIPGTYLLVDHSLGRLDKGAVDLDLPPWQRGRYGTAVG